MVGTGMQLALGAFVFNSEAGRELLWGLNQGVVSLLGYSMEGVRFLFGPLAVEPGQPQSPGFILAIQYLPTIIFFMAFMALLYHVGVMPFVVRLFSKAFVRLLGTSGAESVGTASTIFVGVESAGAVRPFLDGMTRSELLTLLTACMATVASSTMAIYVGALRGAFPQIAGHLVSASVLSAPAAVVISKIILPETEVPETLGTVPKTLVERKPGLLEAIIAGAMDGVKQVAGISALLVAFLGLVALIDGILGEVGQWLHMDPQNFSLKYFLTLVSWPMTRLMGVPAADSWAVASLLGERVVLTEIPAYLHLAGYIKSGAITEARSVVIASYALCGFTHVASVAVFVGGIGALAPNRLPDLSRLGFVALWAAVLATASTGCVAGIFYAGGWTVLGAAVP